LAIVPGLPALPFLVIGLLLLAAAWPTPRRADREWLAPVGAAAGRLSRLPSHWSVAAHPALELRLRQRSHGASDGGGLAEATEAAREKLFRGLGVILPPCRITTRATLPRDAAVLSIREVPAKTLSVPETLSASAATQFLVESLADVLIARAHDFMGLQEAQLLLDELSKVAPASVQQVVPKMVSLATLSEILRRLVEEGVSVRDLASILEARAVLDHSNP
jgi:flagellar biosynthesis component FlhA